MGAEQVEIEFRDEGFGSAVLVLSVNGLGVSLSPVTYSAHPLGDLLRAALAMAVGGERAVCTFEREPDRSRLELERSESDAERMRLTVWNVEVWDSAPEQTPPDREVFEATCTVDAFASAVERAASSVLEAQGPARYREAWLKRFPSRALAALRAALNTGGPSADRRAPPPQLPAWE